MRVVIGQYNVKGSGNVKLQVCNLPYDLMSVGKRDVAGVFDTIIQFPLEAFRPDYKHLDVDLDYIMKYAEPKLQFP